MPGKTRPANLPDFRSPPISEAVLSVQFASLSGLQNVHVGLLWDRLFRHEYPTVQEQAILNPNFETFGGSRMAKPEVHIEAFATPPMPRFWFLEKDEVELLQVQQDRLVHNWRLRPEGETEYPRYEKLRDRFWDEVQRVQAFLHSEQLGEMKPNQCELTYVNAISVPDADDIHAQLHRVTPLFSDATDSLEFENVVLQARTIMKDGERPIGRIFVIFRPAYVNTNGSKVIHLELTARGKPASDTMEAAFDFLEKARIALVHQFKRVTTPELHKHWGIANGSN